MRFSHLQDLAVICICSTLAAGCAPIGGKETDMMVPQGSFTDSVLQDEQRFSYLRSVHFGADHAPTITPPMAPDFPQSVRSFTNSLLSRLIAYTKLPHPKSILVSIAECPGLGEHNIGFNSVALCPPTLAALESESELAFLLGHEACHVILRHGEEDAKLLGEHKQTAWKVQYFTGYFGRAFADVDLANEDVARVRRQEIEADLCAIDLMHGAGLNLAGALALFDLIDKWGKDLRRAEDEDKKTNNFTRSPLGQVADAISLIGQHTPGRLYAKYNTDNTTHLTGGERAGYTRKYIKAVYGGTGSASMGQLPWRSGKDDIAAAYVEKFARRIEPASSQPAARGTQSLGIIP